MKRPLRVLATAIALLALVVLPALVVVPAGALADGDPASDVLLGQDVFYPYAPPVSRPVAAKLEAATAAARKQGFPVKVALIAAPVDLGVVPDLYGQPQRYADFLVQEISFQARQRLIVVMAKGFGVQGFDPAATAAAASLPAPASGSTNDLANAALTAVLRLAKASGHPLAGISESGSPSSSGGSGPVIVVIVLAVLALAAAGGVLTLRRRRAPA
jgi:MYXO-CTERM domain-containing protein